LRLAIAQASDGVGSAVPRRVGPEPLVWRVEPMTAVTVAMGEKETARRWVPTLPVAMVEKEPARQ
jgi:hypothetical protein